MPCCGKSPFWRLRTRPDPPRYTPPTPSPSSCFGARCPPRPTHRSVHCLLQKMRVTRFHTKCSSNSNVSFQEPFAGERHSYLLLPLYSKVLLESTRVLDHIVAFQGALCGSICVWRDVEPQGSSSLCDRACVCIPATLLENGRHAACILLTGPGTEGADGTVVLSKRKMKQDIPDSKVLRIGSGGTTDTSEDIKEAFNRLRFSDW